MTATLFPDTESTAQLSECKQFRFQLTRVWEPEKDHVCYIGLNPSTADAMQDDPTIRRMIGFARSWGCGGIYVVNLSPFRATDPNDLGQWLWSKPEEPVEENDRWIMDAVEACEKVVACWGKSQHVTKHAARLLGILREKSVPVYCLGKNGNGTPKHPLYLAGNTMLELL